MHLDAYACEKGKLARLRDITTRIYIYIGCVNVPFVRDRLPSKSAESSLSSLALPDRVQLFVRCRRERTLIEPGARSYHLNGVKGSLAGAAQSNVYISRSKIVQHEHRCLLDLAWRLSEIRELPSTYLSCFALSSASIERKHRSRCARADMSDKILKRERSRVL